MQDVIAAVDALSDCLKGTSERCKARPYSLPGHEPGHLPDFWARGFLYLVATSRSSKKSCEALCAGYRWPSESLCWPTRKKSIHQPGIHALESSCEGHLWLVRERHLNRNQAIEEAGQTPRMCAYNQTDFVKDRIAVEVQFGKYAFVAHGTVC